MALIIGQRRCRLDSTCLLFPLVSLVPAFIYLLLCTVDRSRRHGDKWIGSLLASIPTCGAPSVWRLDHSVASRETEDIASSRSRCCTLNLLNWAAGGGKRIKEGAERGKRIEKRGCWTNESEGGAVKSGESWISRFGCKSKNESCQPAP